MIRVQIKNKYYLVFSLLFTSFCSQAVDFANIEKNDNYQIYLLDVDHDGVKDAVANNINGNDLIVFLKKNDKYSSVYQGENFTADGVYELSSIEEEKDPLVSFSIITSFNGAGGQVQKHFVKYADHKLDLIQTVTFNSLVKDGKEQNNICIQSGKNESCKTYAGLINRNFYKEFKFQSNQQSVINVSKQYLYTSPSYDSKTKAYLIKGDSVKILKKSTDINDVEWVYISYSGKKEIKYWVPEKSIQ